MMFLFFIIGEKPSYPGRIQPNIQKTVPLASFTPTSLHEFIIQV